MSSITYGDTWEQGTRIHQLYAHGLSYDEICQRENISEHDLHRSLRGFALAMQYQDSEHASQFNNDLFIIFYNVLTSETLKNIRDWIGWSVESNYATNRSNAVIFFSLLSSVPNPLKAGQYLQPAINKWDDLINLSIIINDNAALGHIIETHDLSGSYAMTPEGQADSKIKKSEAIKYANEDLLLKNSQANVQVAVPNTINLIHLQGYKSIANTTVDDAAPFMVLAGPNGSGKSNLADGLAFFGIVVAQGTKQAIRQFGGYNQIHCFKFKKDKARTASLELKLTLNGRFYRYIIKIHQLDSAPQLQEELTIDGECWLKRERGKPPSILSKETFFDLPDYPDDISGLNLLAESPIRDFMINIRVFRFDPLGAKEPDTLSADSTELDTHGRNVATMLSVLEKKAELREQILEWIELLVPGMEKVKTEQQKLDGSTVIKFKEEGMKTFLPAKLISDGTIYALCILTAVLSRAKGQGMTIIEEPERGIHPQAIAELVSLMRANASPEHPVWVTTHSESVVRSANADELWLINKVDGKTELKNAGKNSVSLGNLNLDKAWLMNLFDGGLPW